MMTATKSLVLAMALLVPAWSGRALAQNTEQAPGAVSSAAKDFIIKAHQANLDEIELGHLAEAKATIKGVKEFARRMIHDHTKADQELMQVAREDGVSLTTTGISPEMQKTKDRLAALSGYDFDDEYMKYMAHEHEMDVGEFQGELASVKNPQLKHWIEQTLLMLDDHLKNAALYYGEVLESKPHR